MRKKGTKGGRKLWKRILEREIRYSDTYKTGPEIHPDVDVFLVKYWRCLSICGSEGALRGFRAVGRVWFPNSDAPEKTTMVSVPWGGTDVSPGQSPRWEAVSHQAALVHCRWQSGFWNTEKYLCEKLLLTMKHSFRFPPKINLGLWNWRGQRKGEKGS